MLSLEKDVIENILIMLDQENQLFPQFKLLQRNNQLQLLGKGGFSLVYEMINKERPENHFALKVIGFEQHVVTSDDFWTTTRLQTILCQESPYIVRILDAKEFQNEAGLHLQFILMEKLDIILARDRYKKVSLLRKELTNEEEIIRFAMQIGQALNIAHKNSVLHRDIKLENIFWDENEKVYKLGDFGLAKSVEGDNAETIVYTDGYGAPEIECRIKDSYGVTADIYSFGITLYLLLNDLQFPGSEGYYAKSEVQYHPDFVFPTPRNASEEVGRVIRKMCSYRPKDRYQSIEEALLNLVQVRETNNGEKSEELIELTESVTETYQEEKEREEADWDEEERPLTRAERKQEQKILNNMYTESSIRYCLALTVLITLLYCGMQPNTLTVTSWQFWILPLVVLIEAFLQRVKEFHLFFGVIAIALIGYSISLGGLTCPHIVLIICILAGIPILTLAGALSTGLWMWWVVTQKLSFGGLFSKYDLGWIFLVAVLLVINRLLDLRLTMNKTNYKRAMIEYWVYHIAPWMMILVGAICSILQYKDILTIPDLINRMHLVRTGIGCLIGVLIFDWWDGR